MVIAKWKRPRWEFARKKRNFAPGWFSQELLFQEPPSLPGSNPSHRHPFLIFPPLIFFFVRESDVTFNGGIPLLKIFPSSLSLSSPLLKRLQEKKYVCAYETSAFQSKQNSNYAKSGFQFGLMKNSIAEWRLNTFLPVFHFFFLLFGSDGLNRIEQPNRNDNISLEKMKTMRQISKVMFECWAAWFRFWASVSTNWGIVLWSVLFVILQW